jgi:hypothetical protein
LTLPYKRVHDDGPAVVEAEFELTDREVATIQERFGEGALSGRAVTLTKAYDNSTSWSIPLASAASASTTAG